MKRFVKHTLLFALPLLLLAYPLDRVISGLLKDSLFKRGELEVWNDIYQGDAACDIAIYGSSRAWVHIDPIILQDSLGISAYNFGLDGHNFWLQYLRHLELLEHNPAPKQILLSVDVFTLDKRKDLFNYQQFMPYMLGNERIAHYTSSYQGYNKLDYYLPLLRYVGEQDALRACQQAYFEPRPEIKIRNRGFRGIEREWNDDLQKAKAKRDKIQAVFDPDSVELLEQFLVACKEAGIRVDLVYTPEYIEAQEFVSNRQMVIDHFSQLAEVHNLRFFDYSDDSLSKDRSLFYNGLHLNARGSELFSQKLAADLKATMD